MNMDIDLPLMKKIIQNNYLLYAIITNPTVHIINATNTIFFIKFFISPTNSDGDVIILLEYFNTTVAIKILETVINIPKNNSNNSLFIYIL